MKKYLRKKDDDDEDSGRLGLFGSRSKSKSPANASQNPYAQPSGLPPDPYTQAKMNAGVLPPQNGPAPIQNRMPYQSSMPNGNYGGMSQPPPPQQGGYPGEKQYGPAQNGFAAENKFAPPQGGYGGGGYGADRFGGQSHYGGDKPAANPYASVVQTSGTSRYGPGGYGGLGGTLGRSDSTDTTSTDADRDALFGGARERAQQRQQAGHNGPPGYEYNAPANSGEQRSHGAYGDRQLTAEEEEDEDVEATKQEIKFIRKQDVASTRNALRMAAEAEESGRNTLARLGAQSELLHNAEVNLDISKNQGRIADDKVAQLKKYNRSLFAVHVNNPFTAKQRLQQEEEKIVQRHELERAQREATREAAFKSQQRMNQSFKGLDDAQRPGPKSERSLTEKGKYMFEADSDDERDEDELDRNIDELGEAAKRLHRVAVATGEEVDRQIQYIDGLAPKIDEIDTDIHLKAERLKKFH